MASNEIINFDVIEAQKENIQAIPSGRSAKKLAELFTSSSSARRSATAAPSDTRTVHDHIRAEYEAEIEALAESDDPLDVYDRYVRWTMDTFPSAQATPESQLHTLLERATNAFVSSSQYKNDPRYLKLWLHYINFFSDSPREIFVFLSRHAIGETLALYYEEYAGWLEGAGRRAQAEEVYKMGIEREARPTSRLLRKFGEFEQRREQHADSPDGPSSPALPVVRPALGVKVDSFAAAAAAVRDPQAPRQPAIGGTSSKPARSKMAIFSDANAAPVAAPAFSSTSKGWDNIGSLASRKKENTVEAKSWVGETLKAGGKKSTAPKMQVFRDTSLDKQMAESHITIHHSQFQVTVNPSNGRKERVFVDLRVVYPTPDVPGTELSFEEIWAANRGWLDREWPDEAPDEAEVFVDEPLVDENAPHAVDVLAQRVKEKLVIHQDVQVDENGAPIHAKLVIHQDVVKLDENGAPIYPKSKPRKKKVAEVNETQIIKAKLDSPSKPKIMRKKHSTAEPTMTLHTKAATDDIYDIFNAPLKPAQGINDGSDDEADYESDDYTSGGESVGTNGTTKNIVTSETGDEDQDQEEEDEDEDGDDEIPDENADDETSDNKSVSEWSEFSTGKHIPRLGDGEGEDEDAQNDTQVSDLMVFNDHDEPQDRTPESVGGYEEEEDLQTPVSDEYSPHTRTSFVPIPPEDYVPSRRPYRDPVEAANSRLPFMTPITERTESSLEFTGDLLASKTPCRINDGRLLPIDEDTVSDLEAFSSPLREVTEEDFPKLKISQPLLPKIQADPVSNALAPKALGPKALAPKALAPKGPIVKDAQCNPVDESIRDEILANMHPSLTSYEGFFDHRNERCEKGAEIRKYAKVVGKASRTSTDKTLNVASPVVIQFPDTEREYTVRKELGAGAFAPVYLVENSHPDDAEDVAPDAQDDENAPLAKMGRGAFASAHNHRHEREALKMEQPPSPWEFHMIRLTHSRLGPHHRATASISPALEMHLYQDESFLFLPYFPHGTLLDVVNHFRAEPTGVMDEPLAMFFTIELLRTVEAMHAKQLLHGDIKADNCLLRLDTGAGRPAALDLPTQWTASGAGGWADRGVTLIDFGRAIDMRAFVPDVQFIADWKTTAQDCAEMREGRPWTWQIDYHGLAGTIHCLLFGKYIETVRCDAAGGGLGTAAAGGRRYRVRESLKRYWQTEIWGECFEVLLNPGAFVQEEEGGRMPVLRSLRGVRERMEGWLEGNCERGVGLRAMMAKVEGWAKGKK